MTEIVVDGVADVGMLAEFWQRAWDGPLPAGYDAILARSLGHVAALEGERVVGFVNVASDGGLHAFVLDTAVDPEFRRRGLATELVAEATRLARNRGAEWLHVDYEPHLDEFYRGCGFRPTQAGLIRLR